MFLDIVVSLQKPFFRTATSAVVLVLMLGSIHAFPPILSAAIVSESHPDSVFQIGEELTYNVSYASFDIGRVRIKIVDTIRTNDRLSYKAMAYIDSYKGVPFVNLHSVYENQIDENLYSTWFHSRTKEDNHWREFIYNFDYPRHAIFIEEGIWKSGRVEKRDTLRIDTLYQDGLSLFFLARKYVMTRQQVSIPTVVSEKRGKTYINFTTERTKEEIDAVKYPIDLIHFEGEAGFVGIFGLTGGFEGWFSNDAARVPIIAKMKVLIGNVRIELIEWKRQGWAPPRFIEANNK